MRISEGFIKTMWIIMAGIGCMMGSLMSMLCHGDIKLTGLITFTIGAIITIYGNKRLDKYI